MIMTTTADFIDGRGHRLAGWELAMPGGILFALAGVAFAAVITLLLRGRGLSELKWNRFGLAGGAVSFFVLPTLASALRALSGDDMLTFTKLLGTGALGFALGFAFRGVAAAGALKLAQVADGHLPRRIANEPELLAGDRTAPRVP
ncbi:MAG: hypothetical protein K8S21_12265 [Gemmatimonadetes bacterium]|nr:hypothetical protein [Gemmatimonadota bacterium]